MAQSVQVKAVSWQHEAYADLMLTEPHLSQAECAKRLGFSQAWLSIVKNSDSFRDYWALRRQIHNEALTVGIKEKAAAVAEMSLDVILGDMEAKIQANSMPAAEARENLDLVAKRFGFDGTVGQQKQQLNVQLNIGMVTQEELATARTRLRAAAPAPSPPVPLIEDKT